MAVLYARLGVSRFAVPLFRHLTPNHTTPHPDFDSYWAANAIMRSAMKEGRRARTVYDVSRHAAMWRRLTHNAVVLPQVQRAIGNTNHWIVTKACCLGHLCPFAHRQMNHTEGLAMTMAYQDRTSSI
jgi:hypothetical protein